MSKQSIYRSRMLEWEGVMPFRYGFYHFVYGFALASVFLIMLGLVLSLPGLLWMVGGGWAILVSQLFFMVIMDPPSDSREGARKLYCIVSREALDKMKGNRGKLGAQAGHAFLHAWWDAFLRFNGDAIAYRKSQHAYKITLVVDTDAALVALEDTYRDVCGVSLVTDAGFTVFNQPTMTCLGLGPIHVDDIGQDLKALKTLV